VPGHCSGQAEAEGHSNHVRREGAHHAHVDVGDVETTGLEPAPDFGGREGVHRNVEGQRQRHPVDPDAVDDLDPAGPVAAVARSRREDLGVVSSTVQLVGEVVDLHLDPA
jgi:hypothetical protein